ncbi:C4-dicarboxylate transporter DctA [Fangia hongkongensis]|uniref:C4-dicarboxylate transporter DctA n=1 Tax=Fangia hongkongensis TaxID=270495 RepID=UPI00035D8D4C|nr:C4-dicarboxylate transporter DctA [Fangia hongkongensis]MBK2124154.1 C4-dicarboxylate transporter DctA [Fangia hongkongensis]
MKIFKHLYAQVIIGIILGIILGIISPNIATHMKPFADIFIKLIKMLIAPIIFLTIVSGIAAMRDLKAVGKIGGAALVYFFLTTLAALAIGVIVANLLHPGSGMNIDANALDINAAQAYIGKAEQMDSLQGFIFNIIPHSFLSAFTDGEILQVLFVAILFAIGLLLYGDGAEPIVKGIQKLSKVFFKIIHAIMHYAPLAAFAAMAYTIGEYGLHSLLGLIGVLLCFYLTCLAFIFIVLGAILYFYCRISIFQLIGYIKTEILIVLGTSSSETVLPNLIEKLTDLGCKKTVVGLVIPTGYSFNLDGTAIYLSLAALFIAQATNSHLSFEQQLFMLGVMLISSKGAAGVTGSGFIILASTLAAIGVVPVSGIVIILGIDRFMSEGRAITNMIGNSIGTIIIAKWQKSFDSEKAKKILAKS